MNTIKTRVLENWKFIIGVMLIGIALLPMLYTIFYSLPAADDFSVASYMTSKYGTVFMNSIRYANERWHSWSGLWFYMFIEQLLNPLHHFEIESCGYGVTMIVLFSLFMVSIFAVIATAAKKILGVTQKETIVFYIFVFILVFLNTNVYPEIYYWFVGSSYMMALTMALLTITLTIRYFYSTKNVGGGVILLCITGVVTCNFFQEAILPGTVYIVLWTYFSLKERRILWKKTIPFWCMFLSGVIAVAAPGNYARFESTNAELDLLCAVKDTVELSVEMVRHMVQQPLFIALLAFGIYIGIRHVSKEVKGIYPLLAVAVTAATLVVNAFPIALGYLGVGYLPNRIYFLLEFVLLVGMSVSSILFGMYIKYLHLFDAQKKAPYVEAYILSFVFLLLYSTLIYGQNISKLPWSQTVTEIGNVKQLHDVWQDCLVRIRDSEDRNVVIEMDEQYYDSAVLQLPRVTSNAEDWKNRAVARIWGKETVKVIQKEEQ